MSNYLEMVRLNVTLAAELNKFEGIEARVNGAHSSLAIYKGVEVLVEVVDLERFQCTRVSDGFGCTPSYIGQRAGWDVVQTAVHEDCNVLDDDPDDFWDDTVITARYSGGTELFNEIYAEKRD